MRWSFHIDQAWPELGAEGERLRDWLDANEIPREDLPIGYMITYDSTTNMLSFPLTSRDENGEVPAMETPFGIVAEMVHCAVPARVPPGHWLAGMM